MATNAYALTTRQRLKDWLGLTTTTETEDNLLDRIIDSVTDFIENYIGYRVLKTTYTSEEYDTDRDAIVLQRFPVIANSVSIQMRDSALNEDDWESVDSQYYHIDLDAGIIRGAGGYRFGNARNGFRVTYQAGYDFDNNATFLSDAGAADLEMAAWMLGATIWNMRKGGLGIQSESIGDYSVTYRKSVLESQELQDILDKYAGVGLGASQTPIVY